MVQHGILMFTLLLFSEGDWNVFLVLTYQFKILGEHILTKLKFIQKDVQGLYECSTSI